MPPILIGSEIYRRSSFGGKHPLSIPRVSTALDLIRALGWVTPEQYRDSPRAEAAQLTRFHAPDYVAALERAQATQAICDHDKARFDIGARGNPVYPQMWDRPRTGAGGQLLAAQLTRAGGVVHVPGSGTHHGQPARASGFCYLNDVVLGVMAWLDQGLERVLYLDLDAHHGDGVEMAFAEDPRVMTLSVHEAGRWPFTGAASSRLSRNIPVPEGYCDAEAAFVREAAILPLIRHFRPQAILVQAGADALAEDPLARLALSNNAYFATLRAVMGFAPRLIVTGGGGYNPWSVARCWAGLWGVLNGHVAPERLPPAAEAVLRALSWSRAAGRDPPEHWFTTLVDPPQDPRPVRAEVVRVCEAVMRDLPESVAYSAP
ncbi:acetoin utilization protein AcuC [Plastoroseomonas arctica]|uniref:Acetoin utilization protein AcuC n=1 Tax=Plastoroseomonas arctica TaxID=1509237 RepID=A0AAF1KR37_9PROT|nr:acetoin utilization protein AcuC [Plastoroseomonas arctica]MBR0653817.1 acetoin utilization protein AcuC [Plastoroseomonas arctica]